MAEGDYSANELTIDVTWSRPATDYDVYVHEGGPAGPTVGVGGTNGIPSTSERIVISHPRGVYAIRVVAFAAAIDDNYSASALLVARPDPNGDCTSSETKPLDRYAPENGPIVEVPVFVHVLTSASGEGAVSDERVASQFDALDEDYRDVRVRFRLAGVTRTRNDFWFQDRIDPLMGSYWDALARDPHRFLNIYTNNVAVTYATTQGDFSEHVGGGGLPSDCWSCVGTRSDRVVMHYREFGRPGSHPLSTEGNFTTHEVGHFFGLLHTFNGSFVPGQDPCADTQDCYRTGDLICDTEPMGDRPSLQCAVDPGLCNDPDPIHNFMNVTVDSCMTEFTPEQARRMRCTLEHYRPEVASVVEVAGADRKVSGGGQLSGDPVFGLGASLLSLPAISASASGSGAEANFAFLVRGGSPPTGHLTYRDKGTGDVIKATSYEVLEIVGGTHARLRGLASVNGAGATPFEVEMDDVGDASGDTLSIRILEDGGYSNGGPLLHGNIRID